MVPLKLIVCLLLTLVLYQDYKEREVYWFLFPLVGLVLASLNILHQVELMIVVYNVLLNLLLVTGVVLALYLVTKVLLKKRFMDHSFGKGDLLFFYALGLGFPTITFTIIFTGALLFSLLLHFALKHRHHDTTVPLAGYMSLFLGLVIFLSIFAATPSLYTL